MAKKKTGATATLPTPKEPRPVVEAEETRCPYCGSTERDPYSNVVTKRIAGVRYGKPHTHVIWKTTRCRNGACRRSRTDKFYMNVVE